MNNDNQNGINNMVNQNNNQGIANMAGQTGGIANMVNQQPTDTVQNNQVPVTPVVQSNDGTVPEVESVISGTKCPRCGFNITGENKMCLHCGFVIGDPGANGIATANTINNDPNADVNTEVVVEHIDYAAEARKKRRPILLINLIPTALMILLFILCIVVGNNNPHSLSFGSNIIVLGIYGIVSILFFCFYLICYELILVKADLPWWGVYIPVYSVFLNSRLMTDNSCYFLLGYLPVLIYATIVRLIGVAPPVFLTIILIIYVLFINIKMTIKFAHRFGINPALLIFFPAIMIPIMALNDKYQGV